MAKYLVIRWDGNGSDIVQVEATSLEELTAQLKKDVIQSYHDDLPVDDITIAQYPVNLPIDQWISQERQKQKQEEQEELEKKERAELARLQGKYKVAPPPGRK